MFSKIIKKSPFLYGLANLYRSYCTVSRKKFGYCHETAVIVPPIVIRNPENIFLHEHTNIFSNALISTVNAKFVMKKYSGAAQGLTVRTGNHMSIVGRWFKDVGESEKTDEFDQDVIVEEDVWIASNVTLLAGVVLGRGCVVGAGAVVRKSVPPYAIVLGNPSKIVGFRFTPEEVIQHESKLYPQQERLELTLLEKNYKRYFTDKIPEISHFLSKSL